VPVSVILLLAFFVLVTPAYLVLAMRRVYAQSWSRILLKTAALLSIYLFVLAAVFAGTMIYVLTYV